MSNQEKFSKICLIYLISIFCFVAIRIATTLGAFNSMSDNVADAVFTIIVQLLVMCVLPFLLYITIYKKEKITINNIKSALNEIGFKKVSLKTVILSILLGVCVYIFNIIIASFFDLILSLFGYSGGSGSTGQANTQIWFLFFSLFITAVMPGIFEEVLHRGILLSGIKQSKNIKWAIIVSGIFFGLMHLNINQFFYATIIGMFFAVMAILTNNIWVSIILHFMNNAINVYLNWASSSGSFGGDFYNTLNNFLQNTNFVLVMVCVISIMLVLSVIAVLLTIAIYNEHNKENKIYFKILTPMHMRRYLIAKRNDIKNIQSDKKSINYSEYVSRENDVIPSEQTISAMFNIQNNKSEKFNFKYSIFFYATIVLGSLTTLFTFIWGIL